MKSKSNVKEEYFLNPTTKEACYILGILWADGYLQNKKFNTNKIQLELVKEDLDQIDNVFCAVGKWTHSYRNRKNRKPQASLITSNCKLYPFLLHNDYKIKSLASPTKILSIIPDNLKHYWHRGYFDGDGCFYVHEKRKIYQCSFAGSYEQDWSSFEKLMNNLDINYSIQRRIQQRNNKTPTKNSVLRFCGKNSIIKYGNYIYHNYDGMGLRRKYDKYILIKCSCGGQRHDNSFYP